MTQTEKLRTCLGVELLLNMGERYLTTFYNGQIWIYCRRLEIKKTPKKHNDYGSVLLQGIGLMSGFSLYTVEPKEPSSISNILSCQDTFLLL